SRRSSGSTSCRRGWLEARTRAPVAGTRPGGPRRGAPRAFRRAPLRGSARRSRGEARGRVFSPRDRRTKIGSGGTSSREYTAPNHELRITNRGGCSLIHDEHALGVPAGEHVVEGVVDLLDRVGPRDHFVEEELPARVVA